MVRSATDDGKFPFVPSDDIADVATAALTSAEHDGESLPITGPEALSYAEMTAKIAAAAGRTLRFERVSEQDARRQQLSLGDSPALADAHLSIDRAIRDGRLAAVTDTVRRLLGRPPVPFDRWCEESARAFR